jgi:hypothetical protein
MRARPYRATQRIHDSSDLETPKSARARLRTAMIVIATLGVHAAVLAAAFVSRAPERTAPRTEIVRVLAGHVDELGQFQAVGMADARIRQR